jgi:hypothetical protein
VNIATAVMIISMPRTGCCAGRGATGSLTRTAGRKV